MTAEPDEIRVQHFVEEMGLLFSELGSQRMVGRVLGALLVCDPAHQSSSQLQDLLDASAGSISTTTRTLVQMGMVEKVAIPGERATFYRLRDHLWVDLMRRRLGFLVMMREAAERGLAVLDGASDARTERLRSFRDFYAFMERRMPEMLDEWIALRAASEEEST